MKREWIYIVEREKGREREIESEIDTDFIVFKVFLNKCSDSSRQANGHGGSEGNYSQQVLRMEQ